MEKIEFKPEYHFLQWLLLLLTLMMYAFIASVIFQITDFRNFNDGSVMFFIIIVGILAFYAVYLRLYLIKRIIFDDSITVERYIFGRDKIKYEEIITIQPQYIKTKKGHLLFVGIKNIEELQNILREIKYDYDIEKEKVIKKNANASVLISIINIALLFLLMQISPFFPFKLIGNIADAFIVWFVLYILLYNLIFKKLKK